jgi:hypothetical protein
MTIIQTIKCLLIVIKRETVISFWILSELIHPMIALLKGYFSYLIIFPYIAKKVREVLSKYHPRITLVFLPIRSPKLNLIEVRWIWLQRKAINNSAFRNKKDIGKAVNDWTNNYNATHGRRVNNVLQIGAISWTT